MNQIMMEVRYSLNFRVVGFQSPSHVQLLATPWTAAHQASLTLIISRSLPKFMSIESMMPFNCLILCCPLLLLPSIFPTSGSFPMIQLFASGAQSIGASVSASSECSELISFKINWFDLVAVQWTLKHLLWHYSPKASVLWHSASL